MADIVERYGKRIKGVLSCFDRVVLTGTLPGACHAAGMTSFLYAHGIRIFDYAEFASGLRERVRENAERVAAEAGVQIQFIAKAHVRKEDVAARILAERGTHPGLVAVLSAMEACGAYRPWHDKGTGKTYLKPDTGKCLHYYFYFMDETLGLCHLRVPTWAPFRLQFYFNGHHWLASRLARAGIAYRLIENAFISIADFKRAQALADEFSVKALHRILDGYAKRLCPVKLVFLTDYHWSIMQAEFATDIVFEDRAALAPLYQAISRAAVLAVKAEQVARFLGRALDPRFAQELGSRFSTRIEGPCIKHHMDSAAIKMYDKFGTILRIETTVNNVSFFKHHRTVEQRDGTRAFKLAPLKKSIYSFTDLRELLAAANQRYLAFVSDLSEPSAGHADLKRLAEAKDDNGRTYRGFNFFRALDERLLTTLARGEFNISGLRRKHLRAHLPELSDSQLSRWLKALRVHGLIKRVGHSYKHYLTAFGRRTIITALKLKELVIIPCLAQPTHA
jgi:hypothetical protein